MILIMPRSLSWSCSEAGFPRTVLRWTPARRAKALWLRPERSANRVGEINGVRGSWIESRNPDTSRASRRGFARAEALAIEFTCTIRAQYKHLWTVTSSLAAERPPDA